MSEALTGAGVVVQQLAAALDGDAIAGADGSGYGPQISFGREDGWSRAGVTPLLEYGLLKVHGADAASFLQSQLTSDVAGLGAGEVRLAGYCSVKGRLTASFWIWRDEAQQAFWLACSRDVAAAIAKRLSMFVLRAKAMVEDVSDTMALVGTISVADDPLDASLAGPVRLPTVGVSASVAAALAPAGSAGAAPWAQAPRPAPLADLRIDRTMRPMAASALAPALERMRADGATLLATTAWRRLEVLSGVARINAGNQDLFVPQMVNFELVDGVNFKKGCYPGQEIVARSQYLGKLKRRMFLGLGHGPVPLPGADVGAGEQAAEPVGQVVMAAPLADGERFVVLFESRTVAVPEAGEAPVDTGLRVGASPLWRLPLPYALPAGDRPDVR